jgi:deoxyribodipyrimidine photolyase-like uncharacterized protein
VPSAPTLVLVPGDQLNRDSAAFDDFDPACDVVWMAEAAEESTRVWSHKAHVALFLAAMRHFRDRLKREGLNVRYSALGGPQNTGTLAGELRGAARSRHRFRDQARQLLLCSLDEFDAQARDCKRTGILMENGKPVGARGTTMRRTPGIIPFGRCGL